MATLVHNLMEQAYEVMEGLSQLETKIELVCRFLTDMVILANSELSASLIPCNNQFVRGFMKTQDIPAQYDYAVQLSLGKRMGEHFTMIFFCGEHLVLQSPSQATRALPYTEAISYFAITTRLYIAGVDPDLAGSFYDMAKSAIESCEDSTTFVGSATNLSDFLAENATDYVGELEQDSQDNLTDGPTLWFRSGDEDDEEWVYAFIFRPGGVQYWDLDMRECPYNEKLDYSSALSILAGNLLLHA